VGDTEQSVEEQREGESVLRGSVGSPDSQFLGLPSDAGQLESTAGDVLTHRYRHDHGRYEVLAGREAAREVEGGNDLRGRIERRHGVLRR
jgi:hypothetical protein